MALMHGKWVKIDQKGIGCPDARSSHGIAIVGQMAYTFGGEFKPRVPIDNKLHVFDIEKHTWTVTDVSGDIPTPRVGITMVAVGPIIYLFGGRDAEDEMSNELYSFDTWINKWTLLSGGDYAPPHRSYHSSTADNHHIYIYGGCGNKDRLNDLWAYDIKDKKWTQYPLLGDTLMGRGGSSLVLAQNKIWVVYGFNGKEMDDTHYFDLAHKKWAQVETRGEKPTARSVFSTFVMGKYIFIYGGEVDPSGIGPSLAGKFSGEVYVLDTESLVWARVEDGLGLKNHPGPRGWCACSVGLKGDELGLFVYGGVSSNNDRLDNIFFFSPSMEEDGHLMVSVM